MRPLRLIALALVVLALFAFIWFKERHIPTTDERAERKDKLFATLEQDQVTRLEVTNSHGRFELVKENDEWKLTAPLADDADGGAVTGLLSSLTTLKAKRTLAAADVKAADYGLAEPRLVVTVATSDGTAHTLELGDELPLGDTRAARTEAGDDIYLVNKWIASSIDKDLAGWRSSDLVDVVAGDVTSITVRDGVGRVALAHATGRWMLTEPLADLADQRRPADLISDLNAARIKEFLDQPGDLAALGLEPAGREITIVRSGDKPPLQLAFGAEREVDDARQIACRRGERVFWVDASAVEHAGVDPAEWRSHKLVALDTWAIDRLEITAASVTSAVERKDGVWRAGDVEVDGGEVSRRLRVLADLEVAAFDRPRPDGEPVARIVAAPAEGEAVEVAFHAGPSEDEMLAVVAGRPAALAVDTAVVGSLIDDPEAIARPKPTPTPEPTAAPDDGEPPAPSPAP